MCTWLRQQPGAESDPAMPPTNLVHLMDQHYLSVDDRIELGGWVELLAQAEPATASRATVIRQVLNLPDDWAERCHAVLSRLGQHQPPLTVARLLEDPPLAVIEALTTLVATERDQVRPTRHQLRGLHSIIYAHPDDRALLGTFQALPGVDTFMSWFLDSFAKREQLKLLATGF